MDSAKLDCLLEHGRAPCATGMNVACRRRASASRDPDRSAAGSRRSRAGLGRRPLAIAQQPCGMAGQQVWLELHLDRAQRRADVRLESSSSSSICAPAPGRRDRSAPSAGYDRDPPRPARSAGSSRQRVVPLIEGDASPREAVKAVVAGQAVPAGELLGRRRSWSARPRRRRGVIAWTIRRWSSSACSCGRTPASRAAAGASRSRTPSASSRSSSARNVAAASARATSQAVQSSGDREGWRRLAAGGPRAGPWCRRAERALVDGRPDQQVAVDVAVGRQRGRVDVGELGRELAAERRRYP